MTTFTKSWSIPIAAWLDFLAGAKYSKATITLRRQHLSQFARDAGVRDPWTVTEGDLVRWVGRPDWAAETAYQARLTLRSFYAWARRLGHVERDPAAELPRIRRPQGRARATPDRYVLAALDDADERTALMIRLAREHGMRRSEIAVVHSRDVFDDLLGRSLIVHGKGGKIRPVPLADDVADVILAADGWVFPGRVDGHLSPRRVGVLLSRSFPKGWTGHKLRHRFATEAYAVDHNVFAVQALLGHASPATTLRYVELPDDAGRRLVSAVRVS